MYFAGFFVAFLVSSCWAAHEGSSKDEIPFVTSQINSNDEIPFLVATQDSSNDKVPFVVASQINSKGRTPSYTLHEVPSLQKTDAGRSDIKTESDQPSRGYFYPKPSKPFNLPHFTTLDARTPLVADFAEETERFARSPRRPPYFGYQRPPPPFVPGFIPPHNIRPLPALYGRTGGF